MEAFDIKKIAVWVGAIVFVLAIIFGLSTLASKAPQKGAAGGPLSDPVKDDEWAKGPKSAPVTIVEYSDLQCPACKAFAPLAKAVIEANPEKVRFVYRHAPLPIHAQSELAAKAAEAAGKQGMFWQMHDKLFETQQDWSGKDNAKDLFIGYAESLGMIKEQFAQDIDSEDVTKAVQEDKDSAARSGVTGTPTFFLNGVRIKNPRSLEEFQNLINNTVAVNTSNKEESQKKEETKQPEGNPDER